MMTTQGVTIKTRLKHVYRRLDNKMIDIISGRNVRQKKRIVNPHPQIKDYKNNTDIADALKIANRYDADEFFTYKVKTFVTKSSTTRRITLRTYQKIRDTIVGAIKTIYHLRWVK